MVIFMQGIRKTGRPNGGKAKGMFVLFRSKMYGIGKGGNPTLEASEACGDRGETLPQESASYDYHVDEVQESFENDTLWMAGDAYESFWEGDLSSECNSVW